ncbi:MAG: hypothetical protein AB9866_07285 [Syntrophobacteraceae bacterium]
MKVWPGRPYPFGATWDGSGVNFALFSWNEFYIDLEREYVRPVMNTSSPM